MKLETLVLDSLHFPILIRANFHDLLNVGNCMSDSLNNDSIISIATYINKDMDKIIIDPICSCFGSSLNEIVIIEAERCHYNIYLNEYCKVQIEISDCSFDLSNYKNLPSQSIYIEQISGEADICYVPG